jgi:maltooligosyltrehalose trehalohydrolase
MLNSRYRLGAHVADAGTVFRCWAPKATTVELELNGKRLPMTREADGEWEVSAQVGAGARYRFVLDGQALPDPYSRSQPDGVHGASEVVDPEAFRWHDVSWPGLTMPGLVIYECHVGTMTPEGTFHALIERLPDIKALGVTAIELMPVAQFPGSRGWGYDGTHLYAPYSGYGGPDGLRRFVDAAHQQGLGVILDVVYNHFGPDGNYLGAYSADYFTKRYSTPWGSAVNYDGRNSRRTRDLVVGDAVHWLQEYHIDGLRLDATHAIFDSSAEHILAEIKRACAEEGLPGRDAVVIAEDDRNLARLVTPPPNGDGLDGVWSDDFHHQVHVWLTGEEDGYYADFTGTPPDIASTVEQGWFYSGQPSGFRDGEPWGSSAEGISRERLVYCLQNHDQVGNRAFGERLNHLVAIEDYLAASALLLLAPSTPLLFQGQEFAASSPFLYFTDHEPELGRLVTAGRRKEFARFAAFKDPARREQIPDPQAESTFLRSKLRWEERLEPAGAGALAFHTELLRLRREDPVWSDQSASATKAFALGDDIVGLLRANAEGERLLFCNIGDAIELQLSDPPGSGLGAWRVALCSAEKRFGGDGSEPALESQEGRLSLALPASCATLLER